MHLKWIVHFEGQSLSSRPAVFLLPISTRTSRSSAIAVIADRTACSILTLFIAIATSWPLNKKSVCCQSADPTITADWHLQSAVRTRHLPCWGLPWWCRVSLLTNEPCLFDSYASCSLSPIDTYGVSHFVFVVHFVAKRYMLQQKCLKGQIGTCLLGTCWCNF